MLSRSDKKATDWPSAEIAASTSEPGKSVNLSIRIRDQRLRHDTPDASDLALCRAIIATVPSATIPTTVATVVTATAMVRTDGRRGCACFLNVYASDYHVLAGPAAPPVSGVGDFVPRRRYAHRHLRRFPTHYNVILAKAGIHGGGGFRPCPK